MSLIFSNEAKFNGLRASLRRSKIASQKVSLENDQRLVWRCERLSLLNQVARPNAMRGKHSGRHSIVSVGFYTGSQKGYPASGKIEVIQYVVLMQENRHALRFVPHGSPAEPSFQGMPGWESARQGEARVHNLQSPKANGPR